MADALASLSTAANVAAMISLADTVLKTGTQVYALYCRYKDASLSVSKLVDEIQAATSNIAHVRIFMQEFEELACTVNNGQTIPEIQQIICLIDKEFKLLRKLMLDTRTSSSGGWLNLFQHVTGHIRWSLDDHQIAASCARLHRLSTYMNGALAITGRRNEIVLRNEITATRAEVVKFADTAKRLEDCISILTIVPSTSASGNINPTMPLPLKKSRVRNQGPRLATQRESVLHANPGTQDEVTPSLRIDNPATTMLKRVPLWHRESDMIEIVSLVSEDITLPLTYIRELLRITIDGGQLSDRLIISSEQAESIVFIIDQLLAQSHIAPAASLSRQSQRVFTSKLEDRLIIPPEVDIFSNTTQALKPRSSKVSIIIRGPLRSKRYRSDLWTTQTLLKTTPWGKIKAEIHLIADRLCTEILCFRMCFFSPDRKASNIGAVIGYPFH